MSGVSFPVTRPIGRALVVANPSSRASLLEMLARLGFDCDECDDPYTATLEMARRRLAYRALILSLSSLYREELSLIATVKQRLPHIEIWLSQTDGRQAALAEAMRLGADGLLDEEGLHRIAAPPQDAAVYLPMPPAPAPSRPQRQELDEPSEAAAADSNGPIGEPVLTAEELRALLQDQPSMPPSSTAENQA